MALLVFPDGRVLWCNISTFIFRSPATTLPHRSCCADLDRTDLITQISPHELPLMSSCRGNKCTCECECFQPSRENDAICQECAHGISKHPDKDPPAAPAGSAVQTPQVTTNAMMVFKNTVAKAVQQPPPTRHEDNAWREALAAKKTTKAWKFGANSTKVSTYFCYHLQLTH